MGSIFTVVVAGFINELKDVFDTELDVLFEAIVETELMVDGRVGADGGGDVKLFGTILYFFFFGKSMSVKTL